MLIVVDMQAHFEASAIALDSVLYAIKEAKFIGDWVIIVEYASYGEVHNEITNLVENYNQVLFMTKTEDDGAYEILDDLETYGVDTPDVINICGVNADICVLETTEGLAESLPDTKINVLADACATPYEDFFPIIEYSQLLETHENVVVLGSL